MSRGTFGRKQFFWKTYKFDEKVCASSQKNRISAGRLKQSCQNIFFFMSRKTVKKNLFAGKHYIFVQFFGLWAQENSDFCLELLAWVPELNSLSPQEKFDRNLNFLKKKLNLSSSMLTFKLKYSFFGFDTSAGLSKVQVTCPLEFVFQICCFLSKFHNLSSTFSVLIEAIRSFRNYCWKFFKSFFTCPHKQFVEILYQWKTCYFFLTILELARQDFGILRF